MDFRIHAALLLCLAGSVAGPALADPVPVEAFAASGKIGSPRLSPDGRHVAVSMDLGEGNHALVVHRIEDMQRTALLRLPRYELPVQVAWVSERRLVIAKGRQIGAREQPVPLGEIIASDLDGTNQKYLFGYQQANRIAGLERGFGYISGVPEVRNGHFYMRRLSRGSSRSQLYDVDAVKGTARLVADVDAKDLSFVLDRGGVARYAYGVDDDDRYLLYAAGEDGKDWKQLLASQFGGKFVPYAFSPDGSHLYAFHSVDGGPAVLVRAAADGSGREVLAKDALHDVDDLEWTPVPMQPFAATIGQGKPRHVHFDEQAAESQLFQTLANSFPDHAVAYVNHSDDGRFSLLYAYSDRDPGAWYLFDRSRGEVSQLLASREGIDPSRMGERRPFRFKAGDGLELDGYMTIPAGAGEPARLPTVLLPHGGPHASGDGWAFDNDAQFLASRGYLVLQVNFRGSLGRGDRFERAGFLRWGTRIQDDLLDGLRWAIDQGYADADRICAYGASFGAYSAMMVAVRAPELIKCAAGLSGLYDLKMMYSKGDIGTTRYGRNYLVRVVGKDDAELAANSPTSLASRIQAPVLLVHGEVDERTPLAQARAMKDALEAAGNAPEWMAVPREGHGFHDDANNIAFYRRLEAFLGKHFGPAAPAR